MENKLSIAEIKARIEAEIFTEAEWQDWQADSRKGVQQINPTPQATTRKASSQVGSL